MLHLSETETSRRKPDRKVSWPYSFWLRHDSPNANDSPEPGRLSGTRAPAVCGLAQQNSVFFASASLTKTGHTHSTAWHFCGFFHGKKGNKKHGKKPFFIAKEEKNLPTHPKKKRDTFPSSSLVSNSGSRKPISCGELGIESISLATGVQTYRVPKKTGLVKGKMVSQNLWSPGGGIFLTFGHLCFWHCILLATAFKVRGQRIRQKSGSGHLISGTRPGNSHIKVKVYDSRQNLQIFFLSWQPLLKDWHRALE